MYGFKTLLALVVVPQKVRCAVSPSAPPLTTFQMAGATPFNNISNFSSAIAIQQNQLTLYARRTELAIFQYGIDNLPRFGFSGYPQALLQNLAIWKAQAEIDIYFTEQILAYHDESPIPPCQYTLSKDILGFPTSNADTYLLSLLPIIEITLGLQLGYDVSTAETLLGRSSSVGASAAIQARRAAYVATIAGTNPTPTLLDTALPPVYAYWFLQYYIVPGSPCLTAPPLSQSFPAFVPVLVNASATYPASTITQGTQLLFQHNSTEQPRFAAWLNQVNPPVFTSLTAIAANGSEEAIHQAISFVPDGVFGTSFVALTTSDSARNFLEVEADVVAGPNRVGVIIP